MPTKNEKNEKNEIEYDAHPVFKTALEEPNNKNLSFLEIITQAFCLVFQLQRKSGLKRATDLLETNPKSVILAGIVAMIMFFSFCLITSQLAIHYLTK
jgi:hypothetical protein